VLSHKKPVSRAGPSKRWDLQPLVERAVEKDLKELAMEL
jgi:hypothetical protein